MPAQTLGSDTNRMARVFVILGFIAMLVGGIDPMEGSLAILLGSGLVVIGVFLNGSERRLLTYRAFAFVLVAIGVAAMWGLSAVGGVGGGSGHSMWWGLLILPYPVGWAMEIWGPKSPTWVLLLGLVLGVWYLALPLIVLVRASEVAGAEATTRAMARVPVLALAVIGLLTIGGCIRRLTRRSSGKE